MPLSRQIEFKYIERFNYDYRAALKRLRHKVMKLTIKVTKMQRDKLDGCSKWNDILQAYRSAELSIGYVITMEQEFVLE